MLIYLTTLNFSPLASPDGHYLFLIFFIALHLFVMSFTIVLVYVREKSEQNSFNTVSITQVQFLFIQ